MYVNMPCHDAKFIYLYKFWPFSVEGAGIHILKCKAEWWIVLCQDKCEGIVIPVPNYAPCHEDKCESGIRAPSIRT